MDNKPKKGFKLGSTLYSFTNEWHERRYDFEGLVAEVARRGLGPGLELIGFSSIRGFPVVSDDFAARFKDLMAQHQLTPSCLSINADMAIRRGTMMSVDEAVAYHVPQIEAAAKLGFPVVRCQFAAPAEVLVRLLPLAEKHGIKMGPEVHAPLNPNSPPVMAYREAYAKANSPLLGFVPDFGCSARDLPATYIANLRAQELPEHLIQLALEVWHLPKDAGWKRQEFARRVEPLRADPADVSALSVMFNILSPGEAAAWKEIMGQVVHVHGKFYDFDTDGNETSIPYDELLPVFHDGGYEGFMSSEWEGHLYMRNVDAFDMVAKHQALSRRILDRHVAGARS
ncbi:sugar phosphate isomerase/epimerase [Pelomonas sp. KK5]|uniref:sugar phosphate isomerase/epimerase family protein n=1 Tax=Pelomonas sp. KK5 TaxID=1855730 RepID=UPI00097C9DBE|nr:sugar phosphate isomerase/epimerase [Pelomonas sp. KK5]